MLDHEPPHTLARPLLRDLAEAEIRAAIIAGRFHPGEVLGDDELTTWLGVSRTPIREALVRLERIGLVETAPARFTRVTIPQPEDAFASLQALGALFGGVLRTTVPRLTDAQQQTALERVATEQQRLREGGDVRSMMAAEEEYESWLEWCPNRVLVRLTRETISGLLFKLHVLGVSDLLDAEVLQQRLEELTQAFRDRDGAAAEQVIERLHLLDISTVSELHGR